jgi:predicted permease
MRALFDSTLSALRTLRKAPGFALAAILTIALGVGATTAVFTLISAVLLAPLPYPDAGGLWVPHLTAVHGGISDQPEFPFSYPKFETFRAEQKVFANIAAFTDESFNRTGTAEPERVATELVTPEYFSVLGVRPELGRLFAAGSEDVTGGASSVLLSHGYWQRSFGGDAAVIGRKIELAHQSFIIVGVLPAGFAPLTGKTDLWLPLSTLPAMRGWPEALQEPGDHFLHAVARALPGLDAAAVRAGIAAAGRAVAAAYPTPAKYDDGAIWGAGGMSLADSRRDRDLRRSLLVLLFAVCGVLLVACANVAGLQLARAVSRRRELAVCASLGAGRLRLLTQGLAESFALALAGGATGVALAKTLVGGLVALAPQALPGWGLAGADVDSLVAAQIDWRVAAFAVAATLASAIVAGLVPALAAARTDPAVALRDGGGSLAGAGGHGRHGLRRALVVAQTAAAIVLLVGAGLLMRSLGSLLAIDPGFRGDSVLTLRIVPSDGEYDEKSAPLFHQRLLERVAALPGVSGASLGTCMPLSDNCNRTVVRSLDETAVPRDQRLVVGSHNVGPGFFSTLGIRLVAGREFSPSDRAGSPRVAVLGRTAAQKLFPGRDPIGHRLNIGMGMSEGEQAEVVGVVENVRYGALSSPPREDVYLADLQSGWPSGVLFVRATGDPLLLVPAIRQTLKEIAPDLPLVGVRTMREQAARASSRTRFAALLLFTFATAALLLAALGVYGVVAQMIADRRRELGLRMALGADGANVRRLVMRQGLALAGIGALIGLPGGGLSARAMGSLLYGVSTGDPWTFLGVPLVVAAAAAAACWLPAHRAARLDPASILRAD